MKKIPEDSTTSKCSPELKRMFAARHELLRAWTDWLRADRPHMNDALNEADATNSVMRQLAGLLIADGSRK
jgi:hypothetical protein